MISESLRLALNSFFRQLQTQANHWVPEFDLGTTIKDLQSPVQRAQVDLPKIRGSLASSLGAVATGTYSLGVSSEFLPVNQPLWTAFNATTAQPGAVGESLTLQLFRNNGIAQLGVDVVIGTNQALGSTPIGESAADPLLQVVTAYVAGGAPAMTSMGVSVQWEGYPNQSSIAAVQVNSNVTRLWVQNTWAAAVGAEALVLNFYVLRNDGVTFDLLGSATINSTVVVGAYVEVALNPAFVAVQQGETILVLNGGYTAAPGDMPSLDYLTVGVEITPR